MVVLVFFGEHLGEPHGDERQRQPQRRAAEQRLVGARPLGAEAGVVPPSFIPESVSFNLTTILHDFFL